MLSPHNFLPSKKASMATIVTIIVVLVTFGALIVTQLKVFNTAEKTLEGKDCQVALGLQKAGDSIPFVTYDNSCQTVVVEIPEAKKRDVDTNEDISKEIAKKMMRVWDITHKGTIEGMWDDDDFRVFTGSECLILYELNIDYIPEDTYTQQELYEYMLLNNYEKVDGLMRKYVEYVQSASGPGVLLFPESMTLKETNGIYVFDFKEKFIEEGGQYAISIASPSKGYFERVWDSYEFGDVLLENIFDAYKEAFFPSSDPQNVLQFSSVSFAEQELGCVRK